VEVLDLLTHLNERHGRTIVLVLHDLNQACRYSHHLIAMRSGAIVAEGRPAEVVSCELVEEVFDVRCMLVPDPVSGTPMVVPIGRHAGVGAELGGSHSRAGGRLNGLAPLADSQIAPAISDRTKGEEP
jgi:iron complex transport system ATP-binding protein